MQFRRSIPQTPCLCGLCGLCGSMFYTLARAALFKLDPEIAHDLALKSLSALGPGAALLGAGAGAGEARRVMGIDFPNPVGLAAGLDKNGVHIDALAALG